MRGPASRPTAGVRQAAVERALLRYLELRIAQLERDAAGQVVAAQQSAVRSRVGRLITWLLLVVASALAMCLASRDLVLSALVDPGQLAGSATAVSASAG